MINAKECHNTSPDYQAAVIKNAVEQCGSLKALAEKAGITYDYLGKLKNGQRSWTYALQRLIEDISKGEASMKTLEDIKEKEVSAEEPEAIEVSCDYVAIPNRLGGRILLKKDLPADFTYNKYLEELVLPVSLSAAKWNVYHESISYQSPKYNKDNDWIVVNYNGEGLVMTMKEARERGLQEEDNWFPDLKEWNDRVSRALDEE